MNRSKWADRPGALEKARTWLKEQYPDEVVVILDTFDIAYVGWEGDNDGALISRGGNPELVIVNGTYATVPVLDTVTDQLGEYRQLIEQTAVVLRQYWYRVGKLDEIGRTDRTEQQRAMATAYHYVSILEHMTNRGARDVAEALRTAINDIIERPEEIANSQRLFEDVVREVAPFLADPPAMAPETLPWMTDDADLRTPHGIMSAWSNGRLATRQAMTLMECDFGELVQAAISSDVPLPKDLK